MNGWVLAGAGVLGYLVGSLSPATVIARRRGIDLARTGSGNPGATNIGRALGRRTGLLVAVLDAAKGAVPAAGFGLLYHEAGLLAGFAAVLGHVTSPYLRGRGGRGVATTAGAVLGSQPWLFLVLLVVWAGVLGLRRRVALASVTAAAALPVSAALLGARGWTLAWAAGLALVVALRHWPNLRRWAWGRRTGPGR
jgi:acyl phosphate:glycerol-3-phosphate acyltransferase